MTLSMALSGSLIIFVLLLSPVVVYSQIPRFLYQPTPQVVRADSDTTLHCSLNTTAQEQFTYSWTVNDLHINSSNTSYTVHSNNSLTITGFSAVINDGNYTCWVTNGNWTIRSRTVLVQEGFVMSPSNGGSQTITVQQNNYTILTCPNYTISNPSGNPTYVPQLDLYWRKANSYFITLGTSVSENQAILGKDGKLYLRSVTQAASYVCRIENTLSSTVVSYTFDVQIGDSIAQPTPTILSRPADVSAIIGDKIVMDCISSSSTSTVSWTGPNGFTSNNKIIVIASIGLSNQGTYSCNDSSVDGTFSASLTIRNLPVITSSLQLVNNILWGTSINMSCPASGTSPIEWVWYHNGIKISSSSYIAINSTDLIHSGAYQCFVINLAGFEYRNILLNVHTIPPSFLPDGTLYNRLGFSGTSLTLTCNATGTPMPNYQWKKDQVMIDTGNTDFDFNTNPGSLIVKSLSEGLQGNYTCLVRSAIGPEIIGELNSTGEIYVAGPTVFTSQHHSSFSPYVGESFTLNCSVSHDITKTSVRLYWTLNGTIIQNTSRVKLITTETNVTLFVNSSLPMDHGTYQCHAITTFTGNTNLQAPVIRSTQTEITITDVPSSPVVTKIELLSSTIIEVYWTYSGITENVQSLRIDTQEGNSAVWLLGELFPLGSLTRRNVTIKPYTLYSVRVVIILRNGLQIESPTFGSLRTLEDIPFSSPVNFRAVSRSTKDVSLYWNPPTIPNGVITDYTISYWTHRDATPINTTIGSNVTTYALIDLQGSTMYWIVIAAHTSIGRGPFSGSINITTDPTIGGVNDGSSGPVHQTIWFIFTMCIVVIIIIVTIGAIAAAIRWKKKRKGHKYPVRSSFHAEEADFSPDIVADYEKRKKLEPINTLYVEEGEESVSSQTTLPPSFTYATYASSTDGGGGGESIRLGPPIPPSYINPPSFEETLKSRLNKRRSASMSFLEKAEHLQLGGMTGISGSGWSVGHDPKSAFFINSGGYDDTVDDDSIDKKRLRLQDDLSGGSSDSRLQSNTLATRSGSLATFV